MNSNAFKYSLIVLTVASSNFTSLNPVAAPKYLQAPNIQIKNINEQESSKAWKQLKNKKIVAIKSFKNGGYVYASCDSDNQTTKTLKSQGTYTVLAYANNTPQETHFIVIKSKISGVIYLKSMFMEGKALACDTPTGKIIFKTFDAKDKTQEWELQSGDGINQIYFKNIGSSHFLSVAGETSEEEKSSESTSNKPRRIGGARQTGPCMNCSSVDTPTKSELFQIIELG